MKSNFLLFAWLILLQVGFVSQMKGQYEDILCAPCVLEFINNYNSVIITQMEDALGNQCDLYKIEGNLGQLTWQYVEEYDPLIGCYVPDLAPFSCQLDGSIIYQENIDGSPNCNTNHTNFTSYSGPLLNHLNGSNLPCSTYTKKNDYNKDDIVQLYTQIQLNDQSLAFKFHIQLMEPDGEVKNYYSPSGTDEYFNASAGQCFNFYFNYTANKIGTYEVNHYLIYSDGISSDVYDSYTFEVKSGDPIITPGENFDEICSIQWIRDTLRPYNFTQNNVYGGLYLFGVGQNPMGDTVYTFKSYGFLGSYIKYFDKNGQYLGYVKTGETGDIQETDLSTPSNWMDLYFIWDQRFGPFECLDDGLGNSPETPYHICDQKTIIVDQMIGAAPFDFGCAQINTSNTNISVKYFKFKTWETGQLTFTISPNKADDDIDFVVYKGSISNENIIRCMAAGPSSPCHGPTGLEYGETDTENLWGCNGINNNFLAPLNVERNDEYILQIFNISDPLSDAGFKLEFDFDGTHPFLIPDEGIECFCTNPLCTDPDNLTLSAPIVDAPQNANVCIPIRVRNFIQIQSGQGSISWDPVLLSYKEVRNFGLPGLSDGNLNLFNTASGNLNYLWSNPNPATPINLPNNTILMELCFNVIGAVGQESCIVFGQGTLSTEWENDNGTIPICLEYGKVTITNQVCAFSDIEVIHTKCGLDNGTITLADVNGCTYKWPDGMETNTRTNLSAGVYKITLMPSMIDTFIRIESSDSLNVGNLNIIQPNCGLSNGSIELPQGTSFTYRWNDGNTNSIRNNLPYGTYQVTISDGVCNDIRNIILSQSSGLNASLNYNRQPTCGQSNGKITLNTGSVDHSFLWNESSISGAAPENLKANTDYRVTITRTSDECKDTLDITLTDYIPSASIQASRLLINCTNDTPIQLSVQSETEDLYNNLYQINKFEWSDPSITGPVASLTPTISSTYSVTITDSNGCTASALTNITVDKVIPVGSIETPDGATLNCNKPSIAVRAASNTSNSSYLWINGTSGNAAQVSVNKPGEYAAEVTNIQNGCKDTVSVNISIDTIAPSFTKIYRGEVNCYYNKDTLIINHLTGSYTYAWSNNSPANNNTIVESGTYSITVTDDKNGCTKEDEFIVENNINFPSVEDFEDILTCEHDTSYIEIKTQEGKNIQLTLDGAPFNKSGFITTEPISFLITHQDIDNGCTAESNVSVTIDTDQIAGAVCGDGLFIQSDCECRIGCQQIKLKDDHIINPNTMEAGSYLSIPLANISSENEIIIVNRWGQVVYKKSPYVSTIDEGWRGTYMDTGNPLPDGAYFYQLILIPDDKTCRFSGSVTVVR